MAEQFLTIDEIAALMRVSKRTVYRHIASGALVASDVSTEGRASLRVTESAYDRFVAGTQIKDGSSAA